MKHISEKLKGHIPANKGKSYSDYMTDEESDALKLRVGAVHKGKLTWNKKVTYQGKTMYAKEWLKELKIETYKILQTFFIKEKALAPHGGSGAGITGIKGSA